jgi:hypothetical protein
VGEHLGHEGLVLGAQERRRRPAAQAPVAAGDVVDEVGQALGHRGGRAGGEQLVQVAGRLPEVERPAHGGLADAVHGGAARGLDVGDAVERGGELGLEAPRGDGGEVGLQEHVVDGGGQGAAQRGGRGAVGVVAGAAGDGEQLAGGRGDRVVRDEPERRRLAQHRADHLVALAPALARRAPGQRGDEVVGALRTVAVVELAEPVEHAAAQRGRPRPARLVGQRADELVAHVARTHQ